MVMELVQARGSAIATQDGMGSNVEIR